VRHRVAEGKPRRPASADFFNGKRNVLGEIGFLRSDIAKPMPILVPGRFVSPA
jgi:hypothetical protein